MNLREEKTDEELVVLTLANQDNFLYLMRRYQGKLLNYIKRISNVSHEEAEDVLQEVFIKAYRNLNGFDSSLKFSSWIYRIAHNQVISEYRKRRARPEIVTWETKEDFINNIVADFDLAQSVDLAYLRQEINKIFGQLKEEYREILILRFFEEKSYEEISDILRKPLGTVATLLNRAKKQFKEILVNKHKQ